MPSRDCGFGACDDALAAISRCRRGHLVGQTSRAPGPSPGEFEYIGNADHEVREAAGSDADERIVKRADGALFWWPRHGALDRVAALADDSRTDGGRARRAAVMLTPRKREIAVQRATG